MKRVPEDREGCNEFERGLLRDFELLRKSMQRVMARCHDPRLQPAGPFTPRPTCSRGGLLSTLATFLRKDEGVP